MNSSQCSLRPHEPLVTSKPFELPNPAAPLLLLLPLALDDEKQEIKSKNLKRERSGKILENEVAVTYPFARKPEVFVSENKSALQKLFFLELCRRLLDRGRNLDLLCSGVESSLTTYTYCHRWSRFYLLRTRLYSRVTKERK